MSTLTHTRTYPTHGGQSIVAVWEQTYYNHIRVFLQDEKGENTPLLILQAGHLLAEHTTELMKQRFQSDRPLVVLDDANGLMKAYPGQVQMSVQKPALLSDPYVLAAVFHMLADLFVTTPGHYSDIILVTGLEGSYVSACVRAGYTSLGKTTVWSSKLAEWYPAECYCYNILENELEQGESVKEVS